MPLTPEQREERARNALARKETAARKAAEKLHRRRQQYVRVTDELGELWTIPPGSALHVRLQEDEDAGFKQHAVLRDYCRDPHLPLDLVPGSLVDLALERYERFTAAANANVQLMALDALPRVLGFRDFITRTTRKDSNDGTCTTDR